MPFTRTPCILTAWDGTPGNCNWCNTPIPTTGRRKVWCKDGCRRLWERNHIWRRARIYARRRANYRCTRPGCTAPRGDIEINHIEARNGGGYGPGCHHHQDPHLDPASGTLTGGLEGLCHAHHVEVTNSQAAARRAARPPTKHPTPKRPKTRQGST